MSARFYDKKRKSVKNLFDCYFNILLAITAWFMHVCSQKSSTSSFKIKKIASSQKFVMNFNYDNLTFSNVIIWLCTVWTKQFGPNPVIATFTGAVRTVSYWNKPAMNTENSHKMLRTISFILKSTGLYTRGTRPSFFSLFDLDWFGSDKKRSARKINFLTFSFHLILNVTHRYWFLAVHNDG